MADFGAGTGRDVGVTRAAEPFDKLDVAAETSVAREQRIAGSGPSFNLGGNGDPPGKRKSFGEAAGAGSGVYPKAGDRP